LPHCSRFFIVRLISFLLLEQLLTRLQAQITGMVRKPFAY
jgi:hypothetical protein